MINETRVSETRFQGKWGKSVIRARGQKIGNRVVAKWMSQTKVSALRSGLQSHDWFVSVSCVVCVVCMRGDSGNQTDRSEDP